MIGGKAAARKGDHTQHGGFINSGFDKVKLGGSGSVWRFQADTRRWCMRCGLAGQAYRGGAWT